MSDGNNTPDPKDDENIDTPEDKGNDTPVEKKEDDAKTEEERVEALVAARLKEIKSKLDGAYAERDAEKARADKLEKDRRDAEIKRLEEDGKHKEAAEARLADAEARLAAAERRNVELTRDLDLKDALKAFNFRNEKAADMAFQELVGTLVQDDKGIWQHKSGKTLREAAKAFAEDSANSFLFKAKASNGTGTDPKPPSDVKSKPGSLFGLSQAEVLKLAAEGKLPGRK